MGLPVEFLEDFATFKKGDNTDILILDVVSNLKGRGIVKVLEEVKPKTNPQANKVVRRKKK